MCPISSFSWRWGSRWSKGKITAEHLPKKVEGVAEVGDGAAPGTHPAKGPAWHLPKCRSKCTAHPTEATKQATTEATHHVHEGRHERLLLLLILSEASTNASNASRHIGGIWLIAPMLLASFVAITRQHLVRVGDLGESLGGFGLGPIVASYAIGMVLECQSLVGLLDLPGRGIARDTQNLVGIHVP